MLNPPANLAIREWRILRGGGKGQVRAAPNIREVKEKVVIAMVGPNMVPLVEFTGQAIDTLCDIEKAMVKAQAIVGRGDATGAAAASSNLYLQIATLNEQLQRLGVVVTGVLEALHDVGGVE